MLLFRSLLKKRQSREILVENRKKEKIKLQLSEIVMKRPFMKGFMTNTESFVGHQ